MIEERAEVVGKQAVKAHITKAQLVVAAPQLRLPVGAQRERRVAAADGVFPRMRERRRRLRKVTNKMRHCFLSPNDPIQ